MIKFIQEIISLEITMFFSISCDAHWHTSVFMYFLVTSDILEFWYILCNQQQSSSVKLHDQNFQESVASLHELSICYELGSGLQRQTSHLYIYIYSSYKKSNRGKKTHDRTGNCPPCVVFVNLTHLFVPVFVLVSAPVFLCLCLSAPLFLL